MKIHLSNDRQPAVKLRPFTMDYGEVQIPAGLLESGAPIGMVGRTLEVDLLGKTPNLCFSPGKLLSLEGEWFRGLFDIVLFVEQGGRCHQIPLAMSEKEFFGSDMAIEIEFEYLFPAVSRRIRFPKLDLEIIQEFSSSEAVIPGMSCFTCGIRVLGKAERTKALWFNPNLMGFGLKKVHPGMQDAYYTLSFYSGNQELAPLEDGFRHKSLATTPRGLTGSIAYRMPKPEYALPHVRGGHRQAILAFMSSSSSLEWPEDGVWHTEAEKGFDVSSSFEYSLLGFEVPVGGVPESAATVSLDVGIEAWLGNAPFRFADPAAKAQLASSKLDLSSYGGQADGNRVRDLLESGMGTLAQISFPGPEFLLVSESFDYPWLNSLDVYFYARPGFIRLLPGEHRRILRMYLAGLRASDRTSKATNKYAGMRNAPPEFMEESNREYFAPHDLGSPWRLRTNSYYWRKITDWQDLLPKLVCMCCAEEKREPGFLGPDDITLITDSLAAYDAYHGSPLPVSKGVSDTFDNWLKPGHSLYACILNFHARSAFLRFGGRLRADGVAEIRAKMEAVFLMRGNGYRSVSEGSADWTIDPAIDFWMAQELGTTPFFSEASRRDLASQIGVLVSEPGFCGVPNVFPAAGLVTEGRQKNAIWIGIQFVVLFWLRREDPVLFSRFLEKLHAYLIGNMPFGFPESLTPVGIGECKYIASRYLRTLSSFLLERKNG